MSNTNLIPIPASVLCDHLVTQINHPNFQRSCFIWGKTGIGKSALIRQAVAKIATGDPLSKPSYSGVMEMFGKWGFIDLRIPTMDSSDLKGIPFPGEKTSKWLPPEELPLSTFSEDFPEKGVLFLDELNLAEPSVQAIAYSLILDRKVGHHRLLPGWRVIAAGNLRSENAFTFELGQPLKNRFLHYLLEPNLDAFKEWGFKNNISTHILGFLNYRPEYLHMDDTDTAYAFPTPRSWEYVNEVTDAFSGSPSKESISACIGAGVAAEYLAFIEHQSAPFLKVLQDVPRLLSGKSKLKLKENDFFTAWAFSAGLMAYLREHPDALEAMVQYICSDQWDSCREVARKTLLDIKIMYGQELRLLLQKEAIRSQIITAFHEFGLVA